MTELYVDPDWNKFRAEKFPETNFGQDNIDQWGYYKAFHRVASIVNGMHEDMYIEPVHAPDHEPLLAEIERLKAELTEERMLVFKLQNNIE